MRVLREYQPEDLDALFALDEACFAPAFRFSRSAMRRFAEARRARTVICEDDGAIVGFCIVHVERSGAALTGYVVTLDVAETYRKQGLAREMMLDREAAARAEGCESMLLHVSVDNAGAIRFYEALGWTRRHTVEAFYGAGLDAFVYGKRL
jgi:ribosomal-protein-alanine N-acetyltransferase